MLRRRALLRASIVSLLAVLVFERTAR